MQRIRLLALILVAALAGTATTAGSASARGNVLPDATYTTLVEVLDAQIELPAKIATLSARRQIAAYREVCRMFPTGDPLLAAHRAQCLASVKVIDLLGSECKTERGCLRVWKRLSTAYDEMYRLTLKANAVIDRAVPAGQCRTALRTNRSELRLIRDAGRLQADLVRATADKDERALKQLEKRAGRLAKLKTREPEQIQDAIVDHC